MITHLESDILECEVKQALGSITMSKASGLHAFLQYVQSAACEMPGWMSHKVESRLLGEISTPPDMQMTLL